MDASRGIMSGTMDRFKRVSESFHVGACQCAFGNPRRFYIVFYIQLINWEQD
jgi:hypothetical protein